MLYWRGKRGPIRYINNILLYGFRAQAPDFSPELAEPYIQAGHEMFGYALVDVDLKRCYWIEKTEVEDYSLQRKRSNGLLLTLLNHKKKPANITLSLDAKKAGLDVKNRSMPGTLIPRVLKN